MLENQRALQQNLATIIQKLLEDGGPPLNVTSFQHCAIRCSATGFMVKTPRGEVFDVTVVQRS